jgi:hypothetical protein
MANAYLGEVDIELGGQSYTMVLDWRAIAEVNTKFGKDAFTNLSAAIGDSEKLAGILCVALKKHHEGMTVEKIMDLSPPLLLVATCLDLALTYAVYGPKAKESIEAAASIGSEPEDDSKKKTT